jgi:hypothetical protein
VGSVVTEELFAGFVVLDQQVLERELQVEQEQERESVLAEPSLPVGMS